MIKTSLKHCASTCETSLKHCTNNLKQHLKVLKQERNKLYNTVLNGDKVSKQDVMDYTNLLKSEKIKHLTNKK